MMIDTIIYSLLIVFCAIALGWLNRISRVPKEVHDELYRKRKEGKKISDSDLWDVYGK